jgi:hypothetical protein
MQQEYKFCILFDIILDYLHQLQAYHSTYITNNTKLEPSKIFTKVSRPENNIFMP